MRKKQTKDGMVKVEIVLTQDQLEKIDDDSKKNNVSVGCWLSDSVSTYYGGKHSINGYSYRGGRRICTQKVFRLHDEIDQKLNKMAVKEKTTKTALILRAISRSLGE